MFDLPVIPRCGRPGTLFYCDPPYYDCENDYGEGLFAKHDFETLAQFAGSGYDWTPFPLFAGHRFR
ncbi:hypothetical protein [Roseibium sp. RKSG952]|uniref:hypothetical protein n=1 Tax=Roseibium sp. RKSG952 TaxID=2529384 RepID=UPI0012BC85A2|nr:hypothetical protein [Roseibium sp. RKSG952]MTH94551.1 hypothetical protein [Roseibium sp. RKSG952]